LQLVKPDILERPTVKDVRLPVRRQEMPRAAIPLQVRDGAVHKSGYYEKNNPVRKLHYTVNRASAFTSAIDIGTTSQRVMTRQ